MKSMLDAARGCLVLCLRVVPAVLACIALAAHFARAGHIFPCLALLGAPVLLVLQTWWAVLAMRILLGLGSLLWLWTALALFLERSSRGEPFARMLAILAVVALLTALAGWPLGALVEPEDDGDFEDGTSGG